MSPPRRLSDTEIAEIRRRRPAVRASLACEGLHLSPDTEALFEQFDRERLPMESREERLIARSRSRRAAAKVNAAD